MSARPTLTTSVPAWRRAGSILALTATLGFAFPSPLLMAQTPPEAPVLDPDKLEAQPRPKPKKVVHRHTATDKVSDDLNRRESARAELVVQQMKAAAASEPAPAAPPPVVDASLTLGLADKGSAPSAQPLAPVALQQATPSPEPKKVVSRHTATDMVSDDLNRRESARAELMVQQMKAAAASEPPPVVTASLTPGPAGQGSAPPAQPLAPVPLQQATPAPLPTAPPVQQVQSLPQTPSPAAPLPLRPTPAQLPALPPFQQVQASPPAPSPAPVPIRPTPAQPPGCDAAGNLQRCAEPAVRAEPAGPDPAADTDARGQQGHRAQASGCGLDGVRRRARHCRCAGEVSGDDLRLRQEGRRHRAVRRRCAGPRTAQYDRSRHLADQPHEGWTRGDPSRQRGHLRQSGRDDRAGRYGPVRRDRRGCAPSGAAVRERQCEQGDQQHPRQRADPGPAPGQDRRGGARFAEAHRRQLAEHRQSRLVRRRSGPGGRRHQHDSGGRRPAERPHCRHEQRWQPDGPDRSAGHARARRTSLPSRT